MRKLLSLLLCMLLLTGCGGKSYESGEVVMLSEETPAGISMECEWSEYGITAKEFTFFVRNNTDAEIDTGADFALQRLQDGSWNAIPMVENTAFAAIAYIIRPGEARAYKGVFSLYDYEFSPGTYRVYKEIKGEAYTAEFFMVDKGRISSDRPYGFPPLEQWEGDTSDCVIFRDDSVIENADLAYSFLTKVGLDMDCQLRVAEDPVNGMPTVTDVIHEKGRFLRRMLKEGDITESWYSYLVTDGTDLYLSNGADWEQSLAYEGNSLFLLFPEGTTDKELISMVGEMTAHRLESNITRYQLWSSDGERSASITDTPTEFSMGGIGYGATMDLQDMDGLETAILDLAWEGETLLLTCETLQGTSLLRASLDKRPLRITVTSE